MSQQMNRESKRLASFDKWQAGNPIYPLELAKPGDNSFEEHKKPFPHCPVINVQRLLDPQDPNNSETDRPDIEDENITDITQPGDISPLEMINEQNRLETLVSWPKRDIIDIRKVAATGMYYTGNGDKVKCAFCCGAMKNWKSGGDPDEEHRKYFGHKCPFLKGEIPDVSNVNDPLQDNIFSWKPVNSRFATEIARVASFVRSPLEDVQKSRTLAKSGFFYAQNGK